MDACLCMFRNVNECMWVHACVCSETWMRVYVGACLCIYLFKSDVGRSVRQPMQKQIYSHIC